ncbi:hypothetical protein WN51_09600 [Melipona quadrifasciata]|uniref:Uncharacterized protein n=1 Tax=Melipona quadrifasciata TaxID=166423 RepID=A0A0N0BJ09_9HYME|nr:hypothetical protein WN51_09600 [Melipona quadrifasciata]
MTAMLVSVAELSNIFFVLAVSICFCGDDKVLILKHREETWTKLRDLKVKSKRNMIVLRIHGDELMFGGSGNVMTHSPRIPQMEMMKVHIPFTFKLHESFKSTYTGKACGVTSRVDCKIPSTREISRLGDGDRAGFETKNNPLLVLGTF